ncbi:restriction endonuclease subunit S [Methylorubrum extorquens]|uniref:restriction endonuclease subunit S n=1 Tax=Methylorubrum extorquens TaxID=408 RepID=UPI003F5E8AEC
MRLGNLGRWSSGGTPSKSDETLWDGDVPWICPRDMKSPVVTRAESTVSEKAVGGACKLVPKGTLLLVVRGMILAKTIPTATTAMSATYNQDIKAFHPNGRAIPKFVQLCLQHQTRNLLRHVNTATHGTKKLDAQTIANVVIPLPDLSMQIELSDAITDMDLAMVRLGEEHVRLMRTKAAIQAELLHGKVRVPR